MTKILIVPGIGNSGPRHWQTEWETHKANSQRVQQRDWDHPVCDEWVATLDAAVAKSGEDTVIVAHSLGCLAVVAWAAQWQRNVRGALLVAVPDPAGPNFPKEAIGFAAISLRRLPFPSTVVASTNDPYASTTFAKHCAEAWGSRYVDIGVAGHINAASGLGLWPNGLKLLRQLMAS